MRKFIHKYHEWKLVKFVPRFGKISDTAKGFGLVEIVIVTAIITVSLFAFLQAGILALRLLRAEKENLELTIAAAEALEAVRLMHDSAWSSDIDPLANDTPFYPEVANGKWILSATQNSLVNGRYGRDVMFEEVFRDGSDKIAGSGTTDPDTRKITVTASSTAHEVVLTAYITNFRSLVSDASEAKSVFYEGATTDSDLASFPSDDAGDGDPVQTFISPSGTIEVTKAELYLKRTTSNPSDVYVELRTSPAGTVLGTSQIISGASIMDTGMSWVEFRFPDAITLSPSTSYAIRLRSKPSSADAGSGSAGTIHWGYLQISGSPYAGGAAYRYAGALSDPSDPGQLLTDYDFGFRVYDLQ